MVRELPLNSIKKGELDTSERSKNKDFGPWISLKYIEIQGKKNSFFYAPVEPETKISYKKNL